MFEYEVGALLFVSEFEAISFPVTLGAHFVSDP